MLRTNGILKIRAFKRMLCQTIHSVLPYPVIVLAGSVSLLFHGCMVGPDYVEPQLETSASYLNSTDAESAPIMGGWRELFDSPELNALIDKAEANNLNLQAAWQSVVSSRAVLRRSRSDGLPDARGGLRADFSESSGELSSTGVGSSSERYDADIVVNWEIDLFGRIRRSIAAAEASLEVQEALYQDLMFNIQADVAQLYYRINNLEAEAEVLERSLKTRSQSLDLVRQRFDSGTVSELAVVQTESLLANAESRLLIIQRIQKSLIYSLALLLGETPSTFEFTPHAFDGRPPEVPTSIPIDLLERRPDVRVAERALAEANERVGLAKASFFPSITLRGALGQASRDWDQLFDSNAQLSSIRPGISVPLFLGGSLKANEEQAIALYERRYFLYKQTVISAITEVEDILQSIRMIEAQEQVQLRAVEASRRAREISLFQFERGISDFINALDAERSALNSEQLYLQLKSAYFEDTIDLVRALGGTW